MLLLIGSEGEPWLSQGVESPDAWEFPGRADQFSINGMFTLEKKTAIKLARRLSTFSIIKTQLSEECEPQNNRENKTLHRSERVYVPEQQRACHAGKAHLE